jgi:predicted nucleic acid-binding protein
MRYIFDTSALLTHYRQETGWETVQALFEDVESDIVIASPTLAEFARRLQALGVEDSEIVRVVGEYVLLFGAIIAIDAPVASAAYTIGRRTSDHIPLIDALIAAAAQSSEATLVHRDAHMAAIADDILRQLPLGL